MENPVKMDDLEVPPLELAKEHFKIVHKVGPIYNSYVDTDNLVDCWVDGGYNYS